MNVGRSGDRPTTRLLLIAPSGLWAAKPAASLKERLDKLVEAVSIQSLVERRETGLCLGSQR